MSELRKSAVALLTTLAISAALSAGAVLVLGADARIPVDVAPDGTVTRSASIDGLAVPPMIFAVIAVGMSLSMLPLAGGIARGRSEDRGADYIQGLESQIRMLRRYAVGAGVVIILMQLFVLSRAAGIVYPLGLDRDGAVRLAFFLFGVLFCYFGNLVPKAPYLTNKRVDAAAYSKVNRFNGRVFLLGGIAVCITALIAPFDRVADFVSPIVLTMMALPVLRAAALFIPRRAAPR